MSILLLIFGLILFVMLVVVHEWGHFIAARRAGVEVEEFGIGFPPRAFKRKMKSGFLFTINWLPLGGFVKLKGEHDADTEPGSYGAANIKDKTKIMLAGVVMNLLTAIFLFTIVAAAGMPKLIDNQFTVNSDTKVIKNEVLVGFVEEDSPAKQAGLQVRDQLVNIEQETMAQRLCPGASLDTQVEPANCEEVKGNIESASHLPEVTKDLAGQKVAIDIKRDGQDMTVHTTLRTTQEVEASKKTAEPKGYLGIAPTEYTLQRSTWSAPIVAVGLTIQLTKATLAGIGNALADLFTGHAAEAGQQVTGPVGIFALFKDGSILGFQFILMLVAIISLTLAIMNALPIPALDGGRLFVTWLFRLSHRKLTKKTEERIHGTGFAILMLLFIVITVVDVKRFF